jgi:TRAP-type mannitol/chloroaromatic compound transport system substrate-binding protein
VTIHRWPDEVLDSLEAAWQEVAETEIGDNDDAKNIWESYSKFREEYKVWGENGYLN